VPELSPDRNVQVINLTDERSPVSAVRKAHGFEPPLSGADRRQLSAAIVQPSSKRGCLRHTEGMHCVPRLPLPASTHSGVIRERILEMT
jgi:hypothetical protein